MKGIGDDKILSAQMQQHCLLHPSRLCVPALVIIALRFGHVRRMVDGPMLFELIWRIFLAASAFCKEFAKSYHILDA